MEGIGMGIDPWTRTMDMETKSDDCCSFGSDGQNEVGGVRGRGGGRMRFLLPPPPSPSSQIECDTLNATQVQTLALDSDSLLARELFPCSLLDYDEGISPENDLLEGNDEEIDSNSFDGVPTHKKSEDILFPEEQFVDDEDFASSLNPDCISFSVTDFMFWCCQFESTFPDVVHDNIETLSNNLQNLIFQDEEDGEEAGEEALIKLNDNAFDESGLGGGEGGACKQGREEEQGRQKQLSPSNNSNNEQNTPTRNNCSYNNSQHYSFYHQRAGAAIMATTPTSVVSVSPITTKCRRTTAIFNNIHQ